MFFKKRKHLCSFFVRWSDYHLYPLFLWQAQAMWEEPYAARRAPLADRAAHASEEAPLPRAAGARTLWDLGYAFQHS